MSPYEQEFEELHKLLDRKLGDFRHFYKIEKQRILSAYDIFNSQKVDEYLQREGGCGNLVPGEVDERLLEKRFAIAYRVVSQDHKLQNEDPVFCANAQKILNKAKGILKDRQKDLAYSAWFRAKVCAEAENETEHIEAEKARREAAEEKQKRRELEERLVEAERQRASQSTSQQPTERKVNNPAGCLIWLGILLVIGLLQQFGYHGTISNQGPAVQPRPSQPSPTPEASPSQTPTQTQVPPTVLFTYRARLSVADHFNSKGRDLRKVPNIKVGDILLQDRVNFYQLRRGDAEDQPDPYYPRMSFKHYRALFGDKPVSVFPPGGEEVIINGTPLVDVTVRGDSIAVTIVDAGQLIPNPTPIPTATPTATPGWKEPVAEFVRSFVAAISGHDAQALSNYYAPRVSYFAYGDVNRDFILRHVKDLFREWPIRSYNLAREPQVTQRETGVYAGTIDTSFRIENKREIISGKSRFPVGIRLSEGRYVIYYIRRTRWNSMFKRSDGRSP